MDNAVALVQAYLRVNGYFTVAEYPIVEETRRRGIQSRTDIDILAVRFPGARRAVLGGPRRHSFNLDPTLTVDHERVDMIIGEVKEGQARLNAGFRDQRVLQSTLLRFGCCDTDEVEQVSSSLLSRGEADLANGHHARVAMFGTHGGDADATLSISLGHCEEFLAGFIREHWDVFGHARVGDPALSFMVMLEKARRGPGTD